MVYTGVYDGAQIQSALAAERAAISRHQAEVGAKSERMQRERMEAQQRGAAELDRMYKRAGRISMSVIAGSIAVTSRAIAEYAKTSADARRQVEQLESATGKFQANLGRDLTNSGMLKTLTAIVGWAGKARSALSGVYANAFSLMGMGEGTIAEKDRLWAADSEAQKNWTSYLRLTRMKTAMDIDAAKERGDRVGAATLEAREWKRARLEEIQRDESLTKPDTLKAQEMVTAIANDRIEQARRRQIQDDREQRKARDLRLNDVYTELMVTRETFDIEAMRLRGNERAAQQAEIELKWREKIRAVQLEVSKDALVYGGVQDDIIRRMEQLRDAELGLAAMTPLRGGGAARAGSTLPYDSAIYGNLQLGSSGSGASVESNVATMTGMMKAVKATLERIAARPVIGGWQ